MQKQFETTVEKIGKKIGIGLPFDPNQVWGNKPTHHIRGTVNGMMIRGPLAVEGGRYLILLGPAWRRDCGVDEGISVLVILEAEGPQEEELAEDIAAALAAEPEAREFFLGLATFYRKGYLRWIDATKRKPELRAERIAEVVELLKAGEKQR